jgi:hypothetical protein
MAADRAMSVPERTSPIFLRDALVRLSRLLRRGCGRPGSGAYARPAEEISALRAQVALLSMPPSVLDRLCGGGHGPDSGRGSARLA